MEGEIKFRQKFKETFLNWCLSSTNPAIPKMIRNENWSIRIIWILFFLISLAYCSYTIIDSLIEFLQYKTTVSISKVNELPALFPAVTICNVNPFNEKYAFEYLNDTGQFINLDECDIQKNTSSATNFDNCTLGDTNMDIFSNKIKRFIANDQNITEEDRYYLGFDLYTDMLVRCRYNSKFCDVDSDFQKRWNHEFGSCYTFNSGANGRELYKTSTVGSKQGLRLELTVIPPNVETTFAYKTGIYLIVHNQSTNPFTLATGIFIATGSETHVGINRVFTNKLSSPYSNCLDNLESENEYAKKLFEYFEQFNVTKYSQQFCFTMCFQDKLINSCDCCDILSPSIANATFCSLDEELECMQNFSAEFSNSDLNQFCEYACAEECHSVEYSLDVSSATFPTYSYIKSLKDTEDISYMFPDNDLELMRFGREGFLKVVINYEHLHYTLINENEKYTTVSLFGNLGGQLSLFIGLSILSFCDLIELVCEFIIMFYKHNKTIKKIDIVE